MDIFNKNMCSARRISVLLCGGMNAVSGAKLKLFSETAQYFCEKMTTKEKNRKPLPAMSMYYAGKPT